MTACRASTSAPAPVPLAIARSMLSLGIEASLAFEMASARRGLPSGSPPPSLAATVIARASLVKSLPRRASTIAFLCLIPAHLECPAMKSILGAERDPALAPLHAGGPGERGCLRRQPGVALAREQRARQPSGLAAAVEALEQRSRRGLGERR